MREQSSGLPQGGAGSSKARLKISYRVELDEDLLDQLRGLPKVERRRIGEVIRSAQANFGYPHQHSGVGLRNLSPKGSRQPVYECRVSKALRLVFTLEADSLLYFHLLGTHDEVRRFLRSFL